MIASIFDSGAVYYPTLLGIPILTGALIGWRPPDRSGFAILGAVVLALVLLYFAFDETRLDDLPFFVVLALFLFGLGCLARFVARRVRRRRLRTA